MRYLVLYTRTKTVNTARPNTFDDTQIMYCKEEINYLSMEEFDDKEEAIACAKKNNGSIVEAFEFDIKKVKD